MNILRDSFLFYTKKADIFEVILSSPFYQIGTPHFSLEGVSSCYLNIAAEKPFSGSAINMYVCNMQLYIQRLKSYCLKFFKFL